MASRRTAGFVSAFYNPLKVPDAPTGVSASEGNASATISFTAPTNVGGGAITGYGIVSNTGISNTGSASPITVTGLTNDIPYTFRVWAINSYGPSSFSSESESITPSAAVGLFAGGFLNIGARSNTIDRVSISTIGNATDFGDLTVIAEQLAACSSSVRGLFGGGVTSTNPISTISFVTIASAGDATDFGLLSEARRGLAALSSSVRGVWGGGISSGGGQNTIDYVTIASAGNAIDFGDLLSQTSYLAGCSSTTRGLFAGGVDPLNVIQYITIASTGNSTDFGDLTSSRGYFASSSSNVRGIFAGGNTGGSVSSPSYVDNVNIIDYVTIASTGNAIDFGDLSVLNSRHTHASCSSKTRSLFGGGLTASRLSRIDYITIASLGNSIAFGDLTLARQSLSACSSGHGGL